MRKKNQEKLQKAFLELLATKHIYEIEVKELAEKSNLDRSTLYRHFDSSEIITACYNNIVMEVKNRIINSLEPDKQGNFEEMYEHLFDCIQDNADVLSILLGPTAPPDFERIILKIIKDRYLANINNLYSDYCQWKKKQKRLYDCTTFYANGTLGLLKEWLFSGCKNRNETLKSLYLIDESIESIYIINKNV